MIWLSPSWEFSQHFPMRNNIFSFENSHTQTYRHSKMIFDSNQQNKSSFEIKNRTILRECLIFFEKKNEWAPYEFGSYQISYNVLKKRASGGLTFIGRSVIWRSTVSDHPKKMHLNNTRAAVD